MDTARELVTEYFGFWIGLAESLPSWVLWAGLILGAVVALNSIRFDRPERLK